MKKTLFALAVLASATAANAQRQGQIFVYGDVGYTYDKPTYTTAITGGSNGSVEIKNQNATVNPGIGYQFNDNWAVGANFNYILQKSDTTESLTGTTTTTYSGKNTYFLAGPFVRYTKHMGEHFFVYGQFNASYLHGLIKNDLSPAPSGFTSPESNYNGFDARIFPAIGINISRCFAVTGTFGYLGYQHYKYDDNTATPGFIFGQKYDGFGLTLGREFSLGIQVNLGGHMMHKGHHGMMDDTHRMDSSDDDGNMDSDKKKKKMRKDDDE